MHNADPKRRSLLFYLCILWLSLTGCQTVGAAETSYTDFVALTRVKALHAQGLRGQGVVIALLDGGFDHQLDQGKGSTFLQDHLQRGPWARCG